MTKQVKWGIIGCGGIAARRTIPEFLKMVSNAEIVSVMDVDAARAKQVAEQFNIHHHCVTEAELLAQNVDAVYIASPPNVHCTQTIAAAHAGKHVLCEKPVAVSVEEVDLMEAACRKAGVKFMLAWCMRQNAYNKKARELVQAGALGKMVMGRAQLTCWYPPITGAWRQDISIGHGGSMIDMGTHCLDLLEWIMNSRIVEVAAFEDQLVQAYATRVEDSSTVLVRFANGAHGVVDNYFNIPDAAAQNALELYGTKGSLIARGSIGQDPSGIMSSTLQAQETGYDANQVRDTQPTRTEYKLEGVGIYGQMITLFSECVLNDKHPPVGFDDGRHSVQLVDAIYRSARERRFIKVGE